MPVTALKLDHHLLQHLQTAIAEVDRQVVGKSRQIRLAFACLLARRHLLIEDLPGVGKITLAQALARSLGLSWRRIPFTRDMMPADITGVSLYAREQQGRCYRVILWPDGQRQLPAPDPPVPADDPTDGIRFQTWHGYGVHDASAFVPLMRAAGIPARLVSGYRREDAHAWAEAWIASRCQPRPTPRRGAEAAKSLGSGQPDLGRGRCRF